MRDYRRQAPTTTRISVRYVTYPSKHNPRHRTSALARRDRALLRTLHQSGELVAHTGRIARDERSDVLGAFCQDGRIDEEVDRVVGDVNTNRVAVFDQSDRSAVEGFGGDVTDTETVRPAAESTVGDERGVAAAAHALHSASHGQHLTHARAGLRTLVANDDHGVRLDLVGHNGRHRGVFAVEHACGAREVHAVDA